MTRSCSTDEHPWALRRPPLPPSHPLGSYARRPTMQEARRPTPKPPLPAIQAGPRGRAGMMAKLLAAERQPGALRVRRQGERRGNFRPRSHVSCARRPAYLPRRPPGRVDLRQCHPAATPKEATAMITRGARHLANIRREVIHERQRNALASAHRSLDRLEAEQDHLTQMGWARSPAENRRLGATVTAIADAKQRIAQLETERETERIFRLEPLAPTVQASGTRTGYPPAWFIDGPS